MKDERCRALVWKGGLRGFERCKKHPSNGRCSIHWKVGHCEIDGRYYTPNQLEAIALTLTARSRKGPPQ
jgi:hypothetical protein